jgi:hypothetical protein
VGKGNVDGKKAGEQNKVFCFLLHIVSAASHIVFEPHHNSVVVEWHISTIHLVFCSLGGMII